MDTDYLIFELKLSTIEVEELSAHCPVKTVVLGLNLDRACFFFLQYLLICLANNRNLGLCPTVCNDAIQLYNYRNDK